MVDHDDPGRGRWWSLTQGRSVWVLRVSTRFLTEHSEAEAHATLERLNVARALRESAGRVVVLSRHGLRYVPAIPT